MQRTMTPEIQKKLAGLLPFAPESFIAFTPDEFSEAPKEIQPVFQIRDFSARDQAFMRSHAQSGTFDRDVMAQGLKNSAITGWTNLFDLTGKEIPFSLEAIDSFPDRLIGALYIKAAELTGLTREEKEGLSSRQPSVSEPSSSPARNADASQA